MNPHYQNYLTKKYPALYKHTFGGFDIGDGWFDLVHSLSHLLSHKWLAAKDNLSSLEGRVGQLKFPNSKESDWNPMITEQMVAEALAKERTEWDKVPGVLQVKEKFGGLRFYVVGASEEQYKYIQFAEVMSNKLCEVCGTRARRRRSDRGWITTLCLTHQQIPEDEDVDPDNPDKVTEAV